MNDHIVEKAELWEKRLNAFHSLAGKAVFVIAMIVAEIILIVGLIWVLYQVKAIVSNTMIQGLSSATAVGPPTSPANVTKKP